MSTPQAATDPTDAIITQFMSVGAVAAAFPTTTLSGAGVARSATQHAAFVASPANGCLKDEQGDILAIYFASASPAFAVWTKKGRIRRELELAKQGGV